MSVQSKPTQTEIWLPVPGYEGLYDVSNFGRVRSYHNFGFKRREIPKMITPSKERYGYLQLTLCNNAVHKQIKVHQIVAMAFLPPNPGGMQIDHINGIKTDNRAENLEWVTPKENTLRSVEMGLKPRGERHGNHKLTQSQVNEIRSLYKTGDYSHRKLGKMFGVSHAVIGDIIRNKTWSFGEVLQDG